MIVISLTGACFSDAFALQYGRPNSDVSIGSWTDTTGGNRNGILYDEINEVTRNNANYANSKNLGSGSTSDTWLVGISAVTDPNISNAHVVKYSYHKNTGSGSTLRLVVTLLDGTNTVATWTHNGVTTTWVLRQQTLTAVQANSITDYSNLRLQFTASCTTCTANLRNIQVSWADFEVPDAPTVPGAPTALTAAIVSDTQINLSWTAPANNGGSPITGYKIERESPVGGGWNTLVENTGSTSTTYSNTGLDPNTQYNYRVSAINSVGIGLPSNTASATTNSSVPGAPTALTAAIVSDTQINLSWTAPANNGGSPITGYKIERESPVGGGWNTLVENTGSTSTTYSDAGLSSSTQYNYRVSAINSVGIGTSSNEATTTTGATLTVPSSPTSLTGSIISETQVSLSWISPSNNGGSSITDYTIQYSNDTGVNWITYNDGVSTDSTIIVNGLSALVYQFRVFAVNAIGSSNPSNVIEITITTEENQTTEISQRNPPKVLGLGIYEITFSPTLEHEHGIPEEKNRFENFFPYSINTYLTDHENYGKLGNYDKEGKFFKIDDTVSIPIEVLPGTHLQIQVQLLDEYRSSQIEHVEIYFQKSDSLDKDVFISWDKPDTISVSDPEHAFDEVRVSNSLEDGYLWVVFDIKFEKPFDSDIEVEAGHESKVPVFKKFTNVLTKVEPHDIIQREETIEHFAKVIIPDDGASPNCKDDNTCFDPYIINVLKGGLVIWQNRDPLFTHTITSGVPETGPNNSFNGIVRTGEYYHRIFETTGSFPYYCSIHPWATGIVNVLDENIQVTASDVHAKGINVAGTLTLPTKEKFPIVIKTTGAGKARIIYPNDFVIIETKNLDVAISGHVGIKNPKGNVELVIIRPDGTDSKYSLPVTEDGNYFFPTKLADKWIMGTYHIRVLFNNFEIGNISFLISDKVSSGELGGVLGPLQTVIDLEFEKVIGLDEKINSEFSELGWFKVRFGGQENPIIYALNVEPIKTGNNMTNFKFEYYYLLAVIPIITWIILFRKHHSSS